MEINGFAPIFYSKREIIQAFEFINLLYSLVKKYLQNMYKNILNNIIYYLIKD